MKEEAVYEVTFERFEPTLCRRLRQTIKVYARNERVARREALCVLHTNSRAQTAHVIGVKKASPGN